MTRRLDSFGNVSGDAIRSSLEFLLQDALGAQNVTIADLLARVAMVEGIGLTAAQEEWLQSAEGTRPVDAGNALPDHAHPDLVFGLLAQDGSNAPGWYERSSEAGNAKAGTWTANVVFASDGAGGLVWDSTRGKATGAPGELRSVAVDAAGETMTMLADTDVSLPMGPGDLSVQIAAVRGTYSFTGVLYQQAFVASLDQEITFRGTVQPGIAAGRAYTVAVTLGSNDDAYWTPATSGWKVAPFSGAPGQDGADGEDGYSPVFGVVEDGTRRVLQVADWIPSTGVAETGEGIYRGVWVAGTTYATGEIVTSGGEFYISKVAANQGNAVTSTAHWAHITATGGGEGGGGLQQAEVDARVRVLVADFAEAGNASRWPKTKLPSDVVYDGDAHLLAAVSSADSGKIMKVNASGAWALADDEEGTGGGGGLTESQVDARVRAGVADFAETGDTSRIAKEKLPADTSYRTDAQVDARADARIAPFARQNSPSGTIPAARLPATARRTDAQIDSRADARVRAGVADFAETGDTSRIAKEKLPADTSYRTDAQVDARADARIAPFARQNSPSGTIADARIPAGVTRDSEVAGRLLPAVSSADSGRIAKVSAGGAWALGDDETGSGGTPASTPVLRREDKSAATTVAAGVRGWGSWTEIVRTTVSAAEAGWLMLVGHLHGTANAGVGGGDRLWTNARIVRVRGSVETVVGEHQVYGPRNMGNADAATNTLSRDVDDITTAMDIAQSGDVYRLDVRYWAQSATARTMSHAADATNSIQIGRP